METIFSVLSSDLFSVLDCDRVQIRVADSAANSESLFRKGWNTAGSRRFLLSRNPVERDLVRQERKCKSGLGVREGRVKPLRAPGKNQELRWNEGMKSIDARELVYASAFYMCPRPCASVGPSMQMQLSSGVGCFVARWYIASLAHKTLSLPSFPTAPPPSFPVCASERANSTYFRALGTNAAGSLRSGVVYFFYSFRLFIRPSAGSRL